MKNTRLGRRCAVRLASAAAALTAALILTMMTVAAATINATDVTIRNTAEDKSDYSNAIGVLQQGDKVTVLSKTTDGSGNEWFYVELENGNKGYVKAQWVDNGDAAVPEEETAQPEEPQEAEQEAAVDEEDVIDDDWSPDEADAAAGTPASADGSGTGVSPEDTAESQDSPEVDNGQEYDPYSDPNAQFSVNFNAEENGTGSWYIYNYDTDKQIRIGDLEKLSDAQNAAQKSAASAGRWRTIACILLILLVALLVFLYIVLRRNGGAPAPSRRSRRERNRADRARASGDDEEEDEFDWDSEEADEDASGDSSPEDGDDDTAAPSDEEDFEEEEEDEEEEPAPRKKGTGLFGAKSRSRQKALFAPMDEDEEDDEYYDEGLYDDEDDPDEDDDEEDFDEERAPRKGGFLNMLKNIFSSSDDEDDYDEDEDEDEDDEDYDEDEDEDYDDEDDDEEEEELPPVRKQSRRASSESKPASRPAPRPRPRPARKIEFDEEADYPEDVDLIPAGGWSSPQDNVVTETIEETADAETETAASAAAAVAKPAGKRPAKAAPAVEEDEEEEEEFFADDDDDMEYSFLTSSKRGKRK